MRQLQSLLFFILFLLLLPCAFSLQLRDTAPERYTVQKGDTLWDIAARYLNDPWRWPELWESNKDTIRNPHRIYPGDTLVLTKKPIPSLRVLPVVRLAPAVREEPLPKKPIPPLDMKIIGPFLEQPLLAEPVYWDGMPKVVAMPHDRVSAGANDRIYVYGITEKDHHFWNLYRLGGKLFDPDTEKSIARELRYLGKARLVKANEVSTLELIEFKEEILADDIAMPGFVEYAPDFAPKTPKPGLQGTILKSYRSLREIGRYDVVALNLGKDDGVTEGDVLTVWRRAQPIARSLSKTGKKLYTPEEKIGLLQVFRVFDNASYALITETQEEIHILDIVRSPESS